MPGIDIRTETRSGPIHPLRSPGSTLFMSGLAERGPSTAVEVRSLAEFDARFGGHVGYGTLREQIRTFFELGGQRAHVVRAVGPGAVLATVTANDRAGVPVPTVRFDAESAGPWGNEVDVAVADGAAGTITVTVTYRTFTETFTNISTVADIVARLSKSRYVRAVDLGSVTAAPNNLPAVGTYALAGGTDDRTNVTAATVTGLLAEFGPELGDGVVAAPGYGQDLVGAALVAHAEANQRLALLAMSSPTASSADAEAAADNYNSEYAGLFFPWVTVDDGAGGTRDISPEGFVAAARARAHDQEGPWRSPIGEISASPFVLGVSADVNRDTGDTLDAARVSAIRVIRNSVRLYGWRSLSLDEREYALLTNRDILNRVHVAVDRQLESFVGRSIDGQGRLFAAVHGELVGVVHPMAAAGGLYARVDPNTGEQLDPGYSVTVSAEINTPDVAEANKLIAQVAIRPSPTAALIDVTLVKVGFTASV